MLPLPVHTSQHLQAPITSVPPGPVPKSPLERQCYPGARGLEQGSISEVPGDGGVRKKGGTKYSCMYTEKLYHALGKTDINIKSVLDKKLTDT